MTLKSVYGTRPDPLVKGKRKRRRSRRDNVLLRWNLTLEDLTHRGAPISDRITYKAAIFLERGNLSLAYTETSKDQATVDEVWICAPIPGYNKTAYTMRLRSTYSTQDIISCNCQYCTTKGRLCSHLTALVIKKGVYFTGERSFRVTGGIRKLEE